MASGGKYRIYGWTKEDQYLPQIRKRRDYAPLCQSHLAGYRYDPDTGVVCRLVNGEPKPVGARDRGGYFRVAVHRTDGTHAFITAHRLAVYLMTGRWPDRNLFVDHIDGDRTNNKWSNLRVVNAVENARNRKPTGRNQYKGVSADAKSGEFYARLTAHGRSWRIQRFATAEEAARCYDAYARHMFGESARTNFDEVDMDLVDYDRLAKWSRRDPVGARKAKAGRWRGVAMSKNGSRVVLGLFPSKEDAEDAVRTYHEIEDI